MIWVTLAKATPVHEAERLQRDLVRAGITLFAWIISQSLLASGTAGTPCWPGQYERPFIDRVVTDLTRRAVLIPWSRRHESKRV